MTNPNNAIGTNSAYSGRTSVKAFNDVLSAFTPGIVSGWEASVYSGLTIMLGGGHSARDVAIAKNNTGDRTTINNISADEVLVTVASAPSSDSRIDAIVAYVDNPPQGTATSADNPEACGIISVEGTVSASPEPPSENIIRSAITADGASGTTAYYVVLATVTIPTGTTDLIQGYIQQGEESQLIVMSDASNITMTNVDPGEGTPLAENHFIGVYSESPDVPLVFDYSLTEVDTGTKWIDGSAIYKKTIDTGALPSSAGTIKSIAHNITNLDKVIKMEGYAFNGTIFLNFPPYIAASSGTPTCQVWANSTNVSVVATTDLSSITESYVTLYYTKSS